MNLYFRLLIVCLSTLFKPKITKILEPIHRGFRVLPNDLDLNMHMNNGRYLSIMDLGRLELLVRTGIMRQMMRSKAIPVLSGVQMRYRLELRPWQKYILETKITGWDEKWVFIEQRFIIKEGKKAGETAAIGILKGAFFDKNTKQTVPTSELLKSVGLEVESPSLPEYVTKWAKTEEALRPYTKTQSLKN